MLAALCINATDKFCRRIADMSVVHSMLEEKNAVQGESSS